MAPAWMPGKGLAAGMLHWPVARVLKFCEGNTAQKARSRGGAARPGMQSPNRALKPWRQPKKPARASGNSTGHQTLAAAKEVTPRQRLLPQRPAESAAKNKKAAIRPLNQSIRRSLCF
ncbi:MAG: hypothetical protein CMI07_09145 [Oceanospirillaceae bacterium]|nr:hypothetical protein [Oceanospirillaceae bacterium]|tara:strand:+ start:17723 stop:18076 length:354 start_codon:yes stop_codon:yes gene_type:complete